VLPKPNEEYICAPKLNVTTAADIAQRVLKLMSGMGLSINGKHVYCGDYIYSGHTMTLIMAYFVIRECMSLVDLFESDGSRVARFFTVQYTKTGKIYQITTKYIKVS
jgi:hypothetical protein